MSKMTADALVKAYKVGDSIRKIAARYDLSYGTVRSHLRQAGVTLRHRGRPLGSRSFASGEAHRAWAAMHANGMTCAQVAKAVGVSRQAVAQAIAGLKRRGEA